MLDLRYVSTYLPWRQALTGTMMVKMGRLVAPSLALRVATDQGQTKHQEADPVKFGSEQLPGCIPLQPISNGLGRGGTGAGDTV